MDPERLTVSFGGQGFKQFSGQIDPAQVRDGVIQLQPIAVHRADIIVKGKVVFANGNPAPGANVYTMDYKSGYASTQADGQGHFELTVLELPVEITASKIGEPYITYSGKASANQPDQDVTITVRTSQEQQKEKETFLPVADPNEG